MTYFRFHASIIIYLEAKRKTASVTADDWGSFPVRNLRRPGLLSFKFFWHVEQKRQPCPYFWLIVSWMLIMTRWRIKGSLWCRGVLPLGFLIFRCILGVCKSSLIFIFVYYYIPWISTREADWNSCLYFLAASFQSGEEMSSNHRQIFFAAKKKIQGHVLS